MPTLAVREGTDLKVKAVIPALEPAPRRECVLKWEFQSSQVPKKSK